VVPCDDDEMRKWMKLAASRGHKEAESCLTMKPMSSKEARNRLKEHEETRYSSEELCQMNANRFVPLVKCWGPDCDNLERKGQPKFKRCQRCKRAQYCSKECQISHWKEGRHKKECPELAARASAPKAAANEK